ncbi:thioredoxin-like protein [Tilletiaria anomala UBC 951]|uniref:Thioredoxin-like protein n=1 Tax=Tilletiaria anomala (strain ATCC 24038 / CBS 436.72 / UBC 951) TaxID=1037660 RepID=A0A066VAL7_TILAU|nr:thioredoxin-like protein [Tilletiaria anomala UBC 951]KDN38511.1 thioredoxin-like protein [Tilletiaria anomala UBC 951]
MLSARSARTAAKPVTLATRTSVAFSSSRNSSSIARPLANQRRHHGVTIPKHTAAAAAGTPRLFHSSAKAMGGIHEDVSPDQFKQLVLTEGGAETETVLVDFFATWCHPCKLLAPTLHRIARDPESQVTLVSVDIDKYQELAGAFRISAVPTVIGFHKGKRVKQFSGFLSEDVIRQFIAAVKE